MSTDSTVTSGNAARAAGPIPLRTALRRVIVTNADPDTAAHRAVGVIVEWLREKAVTEDAIGGVVIRGLAREIEAGNEEARPPEGDRVRQNEGWRDDRR